LLLHVEIDARAMPAEDLISIALGREDGRVRSAAQIEWIGRTWDPAAFSVDSANSWLKTFSSDC
jgi:hypothetical protein